MKTFKKVLLAILLFIFLLALGGYFYVKQKFTPPAVSLITENESGLIPINWVADERSPIAALLLPITLEGIPVPLYMQFDLGAHSTLLYKDALVSISSKYPNQLAEIDTSTNTINYSFMLGKMKVISNKFRVIDHGSPIDWSDSSTKIIIGTLGADIVDINLTVLDFKNDFCSFGGSLKDIKINTLSHDFSFDMRKIQFPATLNGANYNLLFDTGTSGFELITSKNIWESMAKEGAKKKINEVKSWENMLTTYTVETNKVIDFGMVNIELEEVTYIEGASLMQETLMRLTGMGGMIGNQLFMGKILVLDCRNEKYTILN
jgi:hypothetical protein